MKPVPLQMVYRIALSGLDGRLVAEAIKLDHIQKMSVLLDDVSSVICHRGIRIYIVQLVAIRAAVHRWVANPSFSQGRESCRLI